MQQEPPTKMCIAVPPSEDWDTGWWRVHLPGRFLMAACTSPPSCHKLQPGRPSDSCGESPSAHMSARVTRRSGCMSFTNGIPPSVACHHQKIADHVGHAGPNWDPCPRWGSVMRKRARKILCTTLAAVFGVPKLRKIQKGAGSTYLCCVYICTVDVEQAKVCWVLGSTILALHPFPVYL